MIKMLLILSLFNGLMFIWITTGTIISGEYWKFLFSAFSLFACLFSYREWYKQTHIELPEWARKFFNE